LNYLTRQPLHSRIVKGRALTTKRGWRTTRSMLNSTVWSAWGVEISTNTKDQNSFLKLSMILEIEEQMLRRRHWRH